MSRVSLTFSDGGELTSWIDLTLDEKFSDPIVTASFTAAPPRSQLQDYLQRLAKGEIVGVLVDNKPQAALMVETIQTRISPSGGVSIGVNLVSPIKNLFEATVDVASMHKVANADTPILDLVSSVVEPFGLGEVYAEQDVAVIKSQTGKNPKATATPAKAAKFKEAQPQPNESVYGFLNRILCRLGLILRMGWAGDLYITAPHYDGDALFSFRQAPNGEGPPGDSFFGDVTILDSNSGQWSFCETLGAFSGEKSATQTNTPKARVLTTDINSRRPPYRATSSLAHKPCFHRDTNTTSAAQATSVSKLVLGLRAENAFQVTGSLNGVSSASGVPYVVDALADVYLHAIGLKERMWIAGRKLHASAGDGRSTELTLIPVGNYTIGDVG